jgi:lysyl-tRNA synthetase class 2
MITRAAVGFGRSAFVFVGGLATLVAATGWLYLLRPRVSSVGGPPVADALPLDELSRRSAISLPVFVGVWLLAALLLGLLARAVRTERLTAALLGALAVAVWTYLTTGTSILVIRQIPALDAFASAATTRAVVLPPLVAGLGCALLGLPHASPRPRAPLILAWFVAAAGLVGAIHAVQPHHEATLLNAIAPDNVRPVARSLVAPLGLALAAVAPSLARRKRRAWEIAIALLALGAILHVLHGYRLGALFSGLLVVALVARRSDFDAPGDPSRRRRLLVVAAGAALTIAAYGAVVIWINRLMADRPYSLAFALRETGASLVGLRVTGSQHLVGEFGEWFPDSVLVLALASASWLLAIALAPWRHRVRQEERERALARDLVRAWGADTLAPFVLRADKSYFFSDDERAFVAYRVVGGVAVVSGDPIGPPAEFDALVAAFIARARRCGWRIAILGASEERLDLYRRHGLHALYHGDEAVVDVASFSVEGRAIRKVRQSIHRLERAGYKAEVLQPDAIDRRLREELERLAREWRGADPNRGFVMALDALFRLDAEDAVFVIGRRPDGVPAGFLHFAVTHAGRALSLSSMPRLRDTPNGFNEWLVCVAVAWAREHGFERVSLNFAPFAALLAPEAELTSLQRAQRQALVRLKGRFQLDNLLLFNRKFLPSWQRRFVVYERRLDLPRVGIAALAAEAYLPFSGRDRD